MLITFASGDPVSASNTLSCADTLSLDGSSPVFLAFGLEWLFKPGCGEKFSQSCRRGHPEEEGHSEEPERSVDAVVLACKCDGR